MTDDLTVLENLVETQQAEIDRLREEKAAIMAAKELRYTPPPIPEGFVIGELRKTIVALHADIARLNRMAERMSDDVAAARQETVEKVREAQEALLAEIARMAREGEHLRHALGMLTTLHPTMEIDALDPVGMAQQIVEHVNKVLAGVEWVRS